MQTLFIGGEIVERFLRNRGRSRALIAKVNKAIIQQRFRNFLQGVWRPVLNRPKARYAISLTSWNERIDDLQLVLLMLIDQDVKPAGIHVWLTEAARLMIPDGNRESFEACGVQFRTCPDYRAHKKWLPMILSGHREPFVLCDDDIFYPREWFGRLVAEDRHDAYVGCRCHRMTLRSDGRPAPYAQWDKQIHHEPSPSPLMVTTGCGGVILHPDRLPDAALDWEAIKRYAFFADDIWLKGAHLARRWPVFKTRYCFPCLELPGTDQSGLLANHNTAGNDEQVRAVWDYFELKELL